MVALPAFSISYVERGTMSADTKGKQAKGGRASELARALRRLNVGDSIKTVTAKSVTVKLPHELFNLIVEFAKSEHD